MSESADLLQEQIEYYRERALEYDEWFFRQGRSARGEAVYRLLANGGRFT